MKVKTAATTRPLSLGTHSSDVASSAVAERLNATIREEVIRLCLQEYASSLKSIILTGSLARDEGSFEERGSTCTLLGDAEFLLVFDPRIALPKDQQVSAAQAELTKRLSQLDLNCRISLATVHPAFLSRLRPHIFAYELRTCGQVVWGDERILSLIPNFAPSEIPLEDAWRLLCNRMIETLEVATELNGQSGHLSQAVLYRVVKLYLDMATSFLLFVGGYKPTYLARAEQLNYLAKNSAHLSKLPFDLVKFAECVTACTRWKLFGDRSGSAWADLDQDGPGWDLWSGAVGRAKLLWRWELEQLTHTEEQVSSHELMRRWMALQPLGGRLRGWLCVLRKRNWHRSWRAWPGWAGRAWQASPRYWIYGAASELFFLLPDVVRNGDSQRVGEAQCNVLRSWLPVAGTARDYQSQFRWQEFAKEVISNYKEFLVDTRS
jgi:hypothetical protein